jgi:hypothetical protein
MVLKFSALEAWKQASSRVTYPQTPEAVHVMDSHTLRREDPLRPNRRTMGNHRCLWPILLLAVVQGVGGTNLPHHGGRSGNPDWLYDWAQPRQVIVSQRMPATGTSDALAPLERSGIPLLRT